MRQVRFASSIAAGLALLAAAPVNGAEVDVGAATMLIGGRNADRTNGLDAPAAICADSQGNVYLGEGDSHGRLSRIDATTGARTTIASGEAFKWDVGLALDPRDENILYVSGGSPTGYIQRIPLDNPGARETILQYTRVLRVNLHVPTDKLVFITRGASGTQDGHIGELPASQTGTATSFNTVYGPTTFPEVWSITVDQNNNDLYMGHIAYPAPYTSAIYRGDVNGASTPQLLAGSITEAPSTVDGVGTAARFNWVGDLTLTPDSKYLFVAESDGKVVRRMDTTTLQVDTVVRADPGSVAYPATTTNSLDVVLSSPKAVSFNTAGDKLYVGGLHALYRIDYILPPACDCDAQKLTVEYQSDAIPDATADAISNISLDTDTWEVVFEVRNVKAISNGHVIAAPVNTQETAASAFTPLVSAFDANDLWKPLQCGLGGIDTPATSLKVRTEWDNAACRTKYEMRYSLISAVDRDDHYCDLTDDNAGNIKVNCSIVLSSVRAFSSTETWAFTAQEAAFAAELNLGTYLNNEVENLLHATMAKCSVKNGPLYVVDCRVPGVWNFEQSGFSVAQSPAGWINAASCASNVVGSDAATAATFVRCNIENDAPIANVQRALANITAEKVKTAGQGSGSGSDYLTFDVDFIVPRKVTTTASASLASFVETIEMKDGKYYYGTADVATLEITVVDTARLSMTALELFNSATPSAQVYDIFPGTSDARFQTALNADATKFTIDFYPAAIREDSAFYRYGPHGINVSFTFSAARRVVGGGTGGAGNVLVEGLNVEGTEATTSSGAQGSAASSSSGTALMAGVAVGAAVLVAGLVGAAVVAVKRRAAAAEKEQL